jgi:hypothetical protein
MLARNPSLTLAAAVTGTKSRQDPIKVIGTNGIIFANLSNSQWWATVNTGAALNAIFINFTIRARRRLEWQINNYAAEAPCRTFLCDHGPAQAKRA